MAKLWKKIIFLFMIFIPGAFALPPCPDLLLVQLLGFNHHLAEAKNGNEAEDLDDFAAVSKLFADHPALMNCMDEVGETPLSFSLNTQFNLCTLPDVAEYLISHGAQLNTEVGKNQETPLSLAVAAYGSIYGTPHPILLKNEFCSSTISEERFHALIRSLLEKGASLQHVNKKGQSIKKIAHDFQVSEILDFKP